MSVGGVSINVTSNSKVGLLPNKLLSERKVM